MLAATVPGAEAILQAQIAMNERLKRGIGIDTIDETEDVLITARRELAGLLLNRVCQPAVGDVAFVG